MLYILMGIDYYWVLFYLNAFCSRLKAVNVFHLVATTAWKKDLLITMKVHYELSQDKMIFEVCFTVGQPHKNQIIPVTWCQVILPDDILKNNLTLVTASFAISVGVTIYSNFVDYLKLSYSMMLIKLYFLQ